jgi:hypothetical protein
MGRLVHALLAWATLMWFLASAQTSGTSSGGGPVSQSPELSNHAAVMLSNGSMLVYGGQSANGQHQDTAWLWNPLNPIEWIRATFNGTAPSARRRPSMASNGTITIVFGGQNVDGVLNDTHVLFKDTWHAVVVSGNPSSRFSHSAVLVNQCFSVLGNCTVDANTTSTFTASHPIQFKASK